MKKRRYATYKKTTAVIFSIIFFLSCLVSITAIAIMSEYDFYNKETEWRVQDEYYSKEISKHAHIILEYYKKSSEEQISSVNPIDKYHNTNLKLIITDEETEETLLQTYKNEKVFYTDISYLIRMTDSGVIYVTDTLPHGQGKYETLLSVQAYIVEPGAFAEDIFLKDFQLFMIGYNFRYLIIAVASFSVILLLNLLLYLFSAAGHRPGEKKAQTGIVEKIPSKEKEMLRDIAQYSENH